LRGASPLAHDDGLNFLRIAHPAAFTNIKYWEVGNEEYGNWEIDHHGTAAPGGTSTGAQHDPATYAAFAAQFASLASEIQAAAGLAPLSIGIDSGDPTGASDGNWTATILADGLANGFVPSFVSDHSYMQAPGKESDSFLLNNTVSAAGSVLDWSTRYADYQSMLQQTLVSQASKVDVMTTEFNSVYAGPGKQTTSLVNGLFIANSLGSLLQSGYDGGFVWDLRNSWDTSQNNNNALYGWRKGGDYGQLGDPNLSSGAETGPYIAYPGYYAVQLVSKIIQNGGNVVPATSSYSDLNVYAVTEPNGNLDLLVINTNPAAAITSQFNLAGFQPAGPAQIWQYGKAEDTAQSLTSSGASSLTHSSATLSFNGANFSYLFPAYSMTVLDLTAQTLTSIGVALGSNNLATMGTEKFIAIARDQFGHPLINQPAFGWSVVGGGQIDSNGVYMPPYAIGSAMVYATSGTVSGAATASYPGAAQWNSAMAGSWASANWIGSTSAATISPPGLRAAAGDMALFASTGTTVSLNGVNPRLAGITFNSITSYTIAAGSVEHIELDNGANRATVTVSAGSHMIAAPLMLTSAADFAVAAASQLLISKPISGSGASLNLTGPGTLTVSAANNYTGGTTVLAGSLVVTTPDGLPSGSSLTVGADAAKFGLASVGDTAAQIPSAIMVDVRQKAILAVVKQRPQSGFAWLTEATESSALGPTLFKKK
jgi:autotransporter-associated beta strand protein